MVSLLASLLVGSLASCLHTSLRVILFYFSYLVYVTVFILILNFIFFVFLRSSSLVLPSASRLRHLSCPIDTLLRCNSSSSYWFRQSPEMLHNQQSQRQFWLENKIAAYLFTLEGDAAGISKTSVTVHQNPLRRIP